MLVEEMDRFTFFASYWEAVKLLPEGERGQFLVDVMECTFGDKEPAFEGIQAVAWTLMEPNIVSSAEQSARNKKNRQGGAAKGASDGRKNGRQKGRKTTEKTAAKTSVPTAEKTAVETGVETTEKTAPLDMDMEMEQEGGDKPLPLEEGVYPPSEVHPCPVCNSAMEPTNSFTPGKAQRYWRCPTCFEEVPYDVHP